MSLDLVLKMQHIFFKKQGQSNYAASKAGVEAFTKSVSKELAK